MLTVRNQSLVRAVALASLTSLALVGCGDDGVESSTNTMPPLSAATPTYVTVPADVAPTFAPETAPPTTPAPTTTTTTAAPVDTGDDGSDDTGETATGECPTTYVIQPGDTTRIGVAQRYGITYEEMDAANASTPGYENFIPGTEIVIPCPS